MHARRILDDAINQGKILIWCCVAHRVRDIQSGGA
jgi:hypothetical protein